jgi:hypothetical protein
MKPKKTRANEKFALKNFGPFRSKELPFFLLTNRIFYGIIRYKLKERKREQQMTITKEKEFIILAENGRQRKININTGEYIGVRGQEIQKLPSTSYRQIYCDREKEKDIATKNFYGALLCILSNHNRNDLEAKQHRSVVLRGVEFCNFLKINIQDFYHPYLTLILENKKDFSAWVKENQVENFNHREHTNFARFLKEK